MARKNANGEGSRPRERADGRWEARYWVDGNRRSNYGNTRKEAADKLAKALANKKVPTFKPTDITVRSFLAIDNQILPIARHLPLRVTYECVIVNRDGSNTARSSQRGRDTKAEWRSCQR